MYRFRTIQRREMTNEVMSADLDGSTGTLLCSKNCRMPAAMRNDLENGLIENAQDIVGILQFRWSINRSMLIATDQISDCARRSPNFCDNDRYKFDHGIGGIRRQIYLWMRALRANPLCLSTPKHRRMLIALFVAGKNCVSHRWHRGASRKIEWNSSMSCMNPSFDNYSRSGILYLELAEFASAVGILSIDLGRFENRTKVRLAKDTMFMAITSICSSSIRQRMLRRWNTKRQYLKRPPIGCVSKHLHPRFRKART